MSFRARIALASAVAVALAIVAASVLGYALVRDRLRDELDASLTERIAQIDRPGDLFGEGPRRGGVIGEAPPPLLGRAGGYVQVVAEDGSTLRGRTALVELPVAERTLAVARGETRGFFADAEVDGTHVRILTTQLAPGYALQLARPLDEVDATLSSLRLIGLFVMLGGIGLAAVLGLAVARTAVAPLQRLTATAEEIAATGDASRRVGLRGGDELGRLGASFDTMLGALEASVQAQRQLVADASHELRTPLTSLRTNVEVLARGGLPEDERTRALDDAQAQIQELAQIVEDVVLLARDGEPEVALDDVRLDLVVADAVARARRHAPQVRFEQELTETLVRGSADRLGRAVGNLLDNASRWSPSGGVVEVRAGAGEVVVRDHGPGIAEADLPHVFDRFYRAPAARRHPGSGLGLAIVRRVVAEHGGEVTAENAAGGGALFRLRLPTVA